MVEVANCLECLLKIRVCCNTLDEWNWVRVVELKRLLMAFLREKENILLYGEQDKILVMRFNNLEGGTRCSRTGEKKIHLSMVAYNVNLVNVIVQLGLERENTK